VLRLTFFGDLALSIGFEILSLPSATQIAYISF